MGHTFPRGPLPGPHCAQERDLSTGHRPGHKALPSLQPHHVLFLLDSSCSSQQGFPSIWDALHSFLLPGFSTINSLSLDACLLFSGLTTTSLSQAHFFQKPFPPSEQEEPLTRSPKAPSMARSDPHSFLRRDPLSVYLQHQTVSSRCTGLCVLRLLKARTEHSAWHRDSSLRCLMTSQNEDNDLLQTVRCQTCPQSHVFPLLSEENPRDPANDLEAGHSCIHSSRLRETRIPLCAQGLGLVSTESSENAHEQDCSHTYFFNRILDTVYKQPMLDMKHT